VFTQGFDRHSSYFRVFACGVVSAYQCLHIGTQGVVYRALSSDGCLTGGFCSPSRLSPS
jgi:hypothetical protein